MPPKPSRMDKSSVILAVDSLQTHFVRVALETKDGSSPRTHVYFSESVHADSNAALDLARKADNTDETARLEQLLRDLDAAGGS